MKKILIIAPHYPPSNLAAVHRSRLFAQHLPTFGWTPIILTVHESCYEEKLDWKLHDLLPRNQKIIKVNAFGVTRPRLIGDIGLRGFCQLKKRALELVKSESIDFVYIPIPSFYTALIGPYLRRKIGVLYGIDYIDPWVHNFPGSSVIFSRHWFSLHLAKILEPFAVRSVSLITGVSESYYQGVIDRNPGLKNNLVKFCAMPYGGEVEDHNFLKRLKLEPYLFKKNKKITFVYAGAMLPKAYEPLEEVFAAICENKSCFENIEIHFIGTGYSSNNEFSFTIKYLAVKYDLWQSIVFEYPKRIPYLDVLVHLSVADAIFILGSVEPHYTPSKVYQGILSGKPIFAVLNKNSTASQVIVKTNAGLVLEFDGVDDINAIRTSFMIKFKEFQHFLGSYNSGQIDKDLFESYSAHSVTHKLAMCLNGIIDNKLP